MAIYGLLVGINRYQHVPSLSGCHADTELFAGVLHNRFQVEATNIKILQSETATRQAIIHGFTQHLSQAKSGDIAVFYFSGHGAQSLSAPEFWDREPDHLDESLVCHDSHCFEVPDLRDKELGHLIAQIANQGAHVAVFLDCCHSGHGTRDVDHPSQAGIRQAPPDLTPRPLQSYLFATQTRSVGEQAVPMPDQGKHLLLSAAQDFQLAQENICGSGNEIAMHGLFTYYLCQTLQSLQYPISYRELRNRVQARIQARNPAQSPQIEAYNGADAQEQVLGGAIQPITLLASLSSNQWQLNAGAMHGLNVGDEVTLLANSADAQQTHTSVAKATIYQSLPFTSVLQLTDALTLPDKQYSAVMSRYQFDKLRVCLRGDESGLLLVRKLLALDDNANQPGHFLQAVDENPRYALHAVNGQYFVSMAADDRALFKPIIGGYDEDNALQVLQQLAVMARWWKKLEINNKASRIPTDAIEIVVNYQDQTLIDSDVLLDYQYVNGQWQPPTFDLVLRLKTGVTTKPLYAALLVFDGSNGAISNDLLGKVVCFSEVSLATGAPNSVTVVKAYEGKPIPACVRDELYADGITQTCDYLKLIVSEEEFNVDSLVQDGLVLHSNRDAMQSLPCLLNNLLDGVHFRSIGARAEPKAYPDWFAKHICLTTRRPLDIKPIGPKAVDLYAGVQIQAHSSFKGRARLVSSQTETLQAEKVLTRHTQAQETKAAFKLPLILQDSRAFAFSQARSIEAGLDSLELFWEEDLTADEQYSNVVSVDNPLILSLNMPLAPNEVILPFTFSGNQFIPLGFSQATSPNQTDIYLQALPVDAQTPVRTRSLGSALKVYFRKLVYRDWLRVDTAIHTLRLPQWADVPEAKVTGYSEDNAFIREKVANAQRVLIVLHGLIGDTQTLLNSLLQPIAATSTTLLRHYDVVLAFDYESLNTKVQESAQALQTALQAVGLGAQSGKQVDVLAHSLGCLVARWYIECLGGDQVVKQLIQLGPPNGGTPLVTLKEHGYLLLKTWAYSNLLTLLNGFAPAYIASAVVAGLVKLIESMDNTIDQLAPDAELILTLAQTPQPQTQYVIVAGNTAQAMIAPEQFKPQFRLLFRYLGERAKLAAQDWLTDTLFKEANDALVSVSSMQHCNPAWQPQPELIQVNCDHLSYLHNTQVLQQLNQRLGD